tara:strand:- start:735 stop:1316 length:582 start_codon:yes stop_codon:yes gene_type:complete
MSMDNQKEEDNLNINQPKTESSVSEKEDDRTVEEKLKESEDKVLRALAEIENQRRRFEKEIKDAFEFGSFNFAKESLSILDNLHRAKEAISNDETLKINKDLDKFIDYIDILNKDLTSIFEKNRIIKISTDKKKFDPNLHQAMSELENDDVEPGTILMEIQAGYMLGERLLRPALVSVAKKKNSKKAENNEKN